MQHSKSEEVHTTRAEGITKDMQLEEKHVQLEEQEQGVSVEGRCPSPNSVPQRSHNLM